MLEVEADPFVGEASPVLATEDRVDEAEGKGAAADSDATVDVSTADEAAEDEAGEALTAAAVVATGEELVVAMADELAGVEVGSVPADEAQAQTAAAED